MFKLVISTFTIPFVRVVLASTNIKEGLLQLITTLLIIKLQLTVVVIFDVVVICDVVVIGL